MGIKFISEVEFGKDIKLDNLKMEYDAVFLGLGAEKPSVYDIGSFKNIYNSDVFLKKYNNKEYIKDLGNVVVIGGGAAGMMAAITSAKEGNKVTLIEKTSSLGNKIKITGKGRCNITSSLDISEFIQNIPGNGKFLYSAFNKFNNIVQYIKDKEYNSGILHCAASTAFLKYPDMWLDAVRIGSAIQGRTLINLYDLKPIGILKSNIQEIK